MNSETSNSPTIPVIPTIAALFAAVIPPLFIGMIDQTVVSTALPDIASELGDLGNISLMITAYLGAVAISAPVYGRLGDAYGRRMLMSVALIVTLVGSCFCFFAPTFTTLVAARAVQGLGGGGLISLAHALLGQYVEPRRRARYLGYLAGIAVAASTFGPVVGGFVTGHLGWRWIFAINVPLVLLALVLINRLPARQTPRHKISFDWIGLGVFSALIVLVLFVFSQLRQQTALWGPVVAAFLCLILLIWRERQAEHPLFPGDLLRRPSISLSVLLAGCHGALYVALLTFIPLYFALVSGRAAEEIGLLMLPVTVGIGTGAFVTGRLVSKSGLTTLFPTVGLIGAAAILILAGLLLPEMVDLSLSIAFAITSVCLGSIMGVVHITAQFEAGNNHLGIATSTILLARSFGAVAGTALAGTYLGDAMETATDLNGAFSGFFTICGVFAFATSGIAAAIPRRRI